MSRNVSKYAKAKRDGVIKFEKIVKSFVFIKPVPCPWNLEPKNTENPKRNIFKVYCFLNNAQLKDIFPLYLIESQVLFCTHQLVQSVNCTWYYQQPPSTASSLMSQNNEMYGRYPSLSQQTNILPFIFDSNPRYCPFLIFVVQPIPSLLKQDSNLRLRKYNF